MDIRPTYLIMVTTQNNNKYYNCFPEGNQFRVEYGRVDATKTTKYYPISKWDSQIRSKLAKGYKDVTDLKQDLVTEKTTDNEYKPIANSSIRALVDRLQALAKEVVRKNYSVSSAAVTQDMVDEAQKIINNLTAIANLDDFNNALLELFTVIPRKMGHVKEYLASDTTYFNQIIQNEQDLLDVMKGQIVTPMTTQVSDTIGSDQTILEANGITIKEVTEQDIELVKRKLGSNAHRLKNVWKVSNNKQTKAYEKYCKEEGLTKRNCKLLFHGTRSENVWNILKTGLVLRPTNAIITGKMFGYGLYFAPSAQKSLGYTSLSGSYWARGNSNSGFMILHSVTYGKPYIVDNFNSKYYSFDYTKLRQECPGAHCLHADSSKGMLKNDEIVVYREDQIVPLYLVEIE